MGSPKSSGRAELPGRPHRKGSTLWSANRRRNRSGSGRQRHSGRRGETGGRQKKNAARAASERMRLIDFWVAALLGVGLYLIYRLRRAARWQAELPREPEKGGGAGGAGGSAQRSARRSLPAV